MLSLKYYPYNLAFEYPFVTSHGTKTYQPTLIVSLSMGNITGYGEAPAITYYNVTVEAMIATLEQKKAQIEQYALTDPGRFWHFLHHLIPGQEFLTAALDIAAWDLWGKLRRTPLYRLLGAKWEKVPVTDYTLGNDSADDMLMKMQAHPWPVYKIKISSPADVDKLALLRRHTNAEFRADANEGLSLGDARAMLADLKALGVTLLEQPLPRAEREAMAELKAMSPIPLYADESCVRDADVLPCAVSFHGINIKLTKCGGITPALRMIKHARDLGLGVMLGSMNESSVGTAAIAHMLPFVDAADADGPILLKEDVASGLSFENGVVTVSALPGLGIAYTGLRDTNSP